MGTVWSCKVVEIFPLGQFCLLIGSVRSLHFTIELRRTGFDVGVAEALVFNIPVEFSLKLMAVVSPDIFDPEGIFSMT